MTTYRALVAFPPRSGNRWAPWCVALEGLANRLLPAPIAAVGEAIMAPAGRADWESAGHLGYRGEMELLRRCADYERLNVFKAFPDLEPNEYVVYDLQSRGIVGIQVKAVTLGADGGATINVYRPALRPSVNTWFVIFLADAGGVALDEQCAVVPSWFVADHLVGHGVAGKFNVGRTLGGRLAQWRVPLNALGTRLAELAASLA